MSYRIVLNSIWLVLILISNSANGSSKEKLKVVFEKNAPEKLYLCSFYGITTQKIDSVEGSSNTFRFYGNSFKKGFYRLFINDTNYVDVILSPEENVELIVNETGLKKGTLIKKSVENQALWELKDYRQSVNKKKKEYALLNEKNINNPIRHSAIKRSIDSLESAANNNTIEFLNKHRNTYFYLTGKSILSPLFTDSILLSDKYKYDTVQFLKENFFNNIDFSKSELVNSTLLPNQYMKYFERHVEYDEVGFKYGVDLILSNAKANEEVYQLSLDFLLKLFNEIGPEVVFEYIVNNYYDKNVCSNEYADKVSKLRSLKVGNVLPETDLSGFTTFASLRDIYSKNKLTVIYFWSSHCTFCIESTSLMMEAYRNYQSKGLEIVGFSIDESENDWKKYIFENDIKWLNFNEMKGWNSKMVRDLLVNKTPSFFLVDTNGVILMKNHNFVEMRKKLDGLLMKN